MNLARLGIAVDSSQVTRAEGALGGLTTAGGRAERSIEGVGRASVTAGSQVDRFGRQMRSSAGHTANLTAQLNDIGVMLAAGQNPLQLALQQGTQINQVFAQMGGQRAALRGIGAALVSMVSPLNLATLGIIAGGAALTQFAISAFSASDDVETLDDALGQLEDRTAGLKRLYEVLTLSNEELSRTYGSAATSVRELIAVEAQLAAAREARSLQDMVVSVGDPNETFEALGDLRDEFDITTDQALKLVEAVNDLRRAQGLDGVLQAAQSLKASFESVNVPIEAMPEGLADAYEGVLRFIRSAAEAEEAARQLNVQAEETGPIFDSAAGSASGLSEELRVATFEAGGLVANLNLVDAALDDASTRGRSAIERLTLSNRALELQVNEGFTVQAAALAAQRDAALERAALEGATLEGMARVGAEYDKRIGQVEDLENANAKLRDDLKKLNGETSGSNRSREAEERRIARELERQQRLLDDQLAARVLLDEAARAAGDYWEEIYAQVEQDLAALDQRLQAPAREFATDIVDGIINSDLDRAFDSLGRKAAGALVDTMFSGQSLGETFSASVAGISAGFGQLSGALKGASGLASLGGVLSGIGGIIGSALPIVGALSAVTSLISGFSKTRILSSGIEGTLGADAEAFDFERKKKSSFFGLVSSTRTNRDRNNAAENALQDASDTVISQVNALANSMGGAARDISDVVLKFKIDTRNMSAEEVSEALEAEVQAFQDRASLAALGSRRFIQEGESASDTLSRLAASLNTFNSVATLLGTRTLPETIRKAGRASEILADVGGADAFATGAQTFFDSFLSAEEQLSRLEAELGRVASGFDINAAGVDEREELTAAILDPSTSASDAAALISLAPLVDSIESLREASEDAAAQLEAQEALETQRIADEAFDLETRLLELQGDTAALRERELEALDPVNRAIQEQIYLLQDQADAAAAAAAETQVTNSLIDRNLSLSGQEQELRNRQLEGLTEYQVILQENIWRLEDAAEMERARASIADERLRLEGQILALEGDEEELRRRELELLSPSNRALQQRIWNLEDEADALDAANASRDAALRAVDSYEFATIFDYRRARADALAGREVFAGAPDPFGPNGEMGKMRRDIEALGATMRIVAANTGETADATIDLLAAQVT